MDTSHLITMFVVLLVPLVVMGYLFSRHRSVWTVGLRPLLIAGMIVGVMGLIASHVQTGEAPKRKGPAPTFDYGRP